MDSHLLYNDELDEGYSAFEEEYPGEFDEFIDDDPIDNIPEREELEELDDDIVDSARFNLINRCKFVYSRSNLKYKKGEQCKEGSLENIDYCKKHKKYAKKTAKTTGKRKRKEKTVKEKRPPKKKKKLDDDKMYDNLLNAMKGVEISNEGTQSKNNNNNNNKEQIEIEDIEGSHQFTVRLVDGAVVRQFYSKAVGYAGKIITKKSEGSINFDGVAEKLNNNEKLRMIFNRLYDEYCPNFMAGEMSPWKAVIVITIVCLCSTAYENKSSENQFKNSNQNNQIETNNGEQQPE